jgi:hypothetical protein
MRREGMPPTWPWLLHGLAFFPLPFALLWWSTGAPVLVCSAPNLVGVWRTRVHAIAMNAMLAKVKSDHRMHIGVFVGAAVAYVLVTWLSLADTDLSVAHLWNAFVASIAAAVVVVVGQQALDAFYDEAIRGDVPQRAYPFEWLGIVVGFGLQLFSYTFI